MRLPSFGVALAVALSPSFVTAAPSRKCEHKIKESINPPRGWVKHGPAPSDHLINLRIALPQPNFSILEQHLYEVSNPDHERYGAHLSKEEVEGLVAPHPESIDMVDNWLASHGFQSSDLVRSPAKDWVTIEVPVSLAEKMLDTTYHIWKHTESSEYILRTTSYSLPQDLHEHIELIQPTTMFARWKGMKSTLHWEGGTVVENIVNSAAQTFKTIAGSDYVDPSCNVSITISCLQQLYNAVGYTPRATDKNQIGITGYLEQFANNEDLRAFYVDQRKDAVGSTYKFVSVAGGENRQSLSEAGAEANLDVQFAFGLSYPTPGTFWSTAGRPPFTADSGTPTNTNEPYDDWLKFVLSQPDVPQVISTSYGDHEQTVPESYARRACADFGQLGARGVSLLFSSGDGGVGDGISDPAKQQCQTNDGRGVTRFIPGFPASCPYVTAVGGTNNVPEVGVYFSGGGFSDIFPRPSYQDSAVTTFLDKLPSGTYEGLFNRSGRAIPDVAAQGLRFRIYYRGKPFSIGGTSASSPTFAGLVALLNDARLAQGKPVLGFLNPLLYTTGVSGFNDITEGNNPGCGTPGFNATEGWDPVTGLGTPNFGKLKDLFTS